MNPIKLLLVLLFFQPVFNRVMAQDTVALRSGQIIIAPIDEVGEDYIIYTIPDDQGKPQSRTLPKSEIRRINYKNGFVETLGTHIEVDKIQLRNGRVLSYKVLELGDSAVFVDAGRKDSAILLDEVATISYSTGYLEKLHDLLVNVTPPAKAPRAGSSDSAHLKQESKSFVENTPPQKQASESVSPEHSPENAGNALNPNEAVAIGVGTIIDIKSRISDQFYFYDLLVRNPMHTTEDKKLVPVLTLRRGLCEYYVTGNINADVNTFVLWKNGRQSAKFEIPNDRLFSLEDIFKKLYIRIDSVISNKAHTARSIRLSYPRSYLSEFAATKPMRNNILLNAVNFTPSLDDYAEITRAYVKPTMEIDTATLAQLFSPSYRRLSSKRKAKNPQLGRYTAALDECEQVIPESPFLDPHDRWENKHPMFYFDRQLKMKPMVSTDFSFLEGLRPTYTNSKLGGFIFESSFVDDKVKNAARDAALPLYKRPGTVLTYLQCGKNFEGKGLPDAGIECFTAGLFMVDGLNVAPSFKEFLKASLFNEMAKCYRTNGQLASALISENLFRIHYKLANSHVYDKDNRSFYDATQRLIEYFDKVEADALEARKQKRAAGWAALAGGLVTAVSAYSDAVSGASTASSTTQMLAKMTTDSLEKGNEIKSASITATEKEGEVFDKAFGEMMSQLHADNSNLGASRPVFAMDIVQVLSNAKVAYEIKNDLADLQRSIPAIRPLLTSYFDGIDSGQSGTMLKDLYVKFGKLELEIYAEEAAGKVTSEKLLLNYQ